jgi:hypothetical protein
MRHAASVLLVALVLATGLLQPVAAQSHDDVAKFLAGLQPSAGSPLAALAGQSTWQQHARSLDNSWKDVERRQLSRIRAWSEANIKDPQKTMLYMFSGPDYLYANVFFPKASVYVMSGLEPSGPIPEISPAVRGQLATALGGLRTSLNSILSYSFFITKNMKTQLAASRLNGTLPVIYVFLARAGKTITDISLVSISAEGEVVPAAQGPQSAQGAKIEFNGGPGTDKQTLYYFRTDLSDGGVKNSGFLKFCEKLGRADAFVKSASYLMHSDGFSRVREFLLQQSEHLAQDDSGVPVRFFKPDQWQLKPFGNYVGPISLFTGNYQAKLKEVFVREKAPRVDFGVGYRWRPGETNLLLAVRKK